MYLKETVNNIMYDSKMRIVKKYGRLKGKEAIIVGDLMLDMNEQLREQNQEYVEYDKYLELVSENIQQKHEIEELKETIKILKKVFKEDQ